MPDECTGAEDGTHIYDGIIFSWVVTDQEARPLSYHLTALEARKASGN